MGWPEGEPRHGLRREAQRHAAFARPKSFASPEDFRPPESGVAAPALPPQSKTVPRQPAIAAKHGRSNFIMLKSEPSQVGYNAFLRSGEQDIHAFAESRRGRGRETQTSQTNPLPPNTTTAGAGGA